MRSREPCSLADSMQVWRRMCSVLPDSATARSTPVLLQQSSRGSR